MRGKSVNCFLCGGLMGNAKMYFIEVKLLEVGLLQEERRAKIQLYREET